MKKKIIASLILGISCSPVLTPKVYDFFSTLKTKSSNNYQDFGSVSNGIEVHFTPYEDCTSIICEKILSAKKTIHIQAYSFTCRIIWNAILNRWLAGVKVYIILDQSQKFAQYSLYKDIQSTDIDLYIDSPKGIAHNKIIIIDADDGGILITGSFNFSNSAQKRNVENILVIDGSKYQKIIKLYKDNWEKRKLVSKQVSNI